MESKLISKFGQPTLVIDDNDLTTEFCEVSSTLAYWATLAAEHEANMQAAKYKLEHVRASQTELARAYLTSKNERATDGRSEAKALNTNPVIEAENNYIEAIRERNYSRGIVLAIQCKRDMLISLGQLKRAELKLEPYIKE